MLCQHVKHHNCNAVIQTLRVEQTLHWVPCGRRRRHRRAENIAGTSQQQHRRKVSAASLVATPLNLFIAADCKPAPINAVMTALSARSDATGVSRSLQAAMLAGLSRPMGDGTSSRCVLTWVTAWRVGPANCALRHHGC
jgi:hypothetical protein